MIRASTPCSGEALGAELVGSALPARSPEDCRRFLDELIRGRGEDYASLSRLIGRNPAYVQQYIRRGVPKRLQEQDRRLLARYFGVSEARLGGPGEETVSRVRISMMEARLAAGTGTPAGPGRPQTVLELDLQTLRGLTGIRSTERLFFLSVVGDAMAPTLVDQDLILAERLDGSSVARGGIYVFWVDSSLRVARLRMNRGSRLQLTFDNDDFRQSEADELSAWRVIGRVVWACRRPQ